MKNSLPLLALLVSAGCSTDPDGSLQAGNWEQVATIRAITIPGAPEAVQRSAQAMIGKEQKQESCLSEAEAKLGIKRMAEAMQDGQCQASDFTAGDGKLTGKIACKTGTKGAADMAITGTYTRTTFTMNAAMTVKDQSVPGGTAQMQMEMKARRIGECQASRS
jgi:hypothetical protein